MLSGERRWAASSRRGGMTVLGKVAVPKPINLPSQRLENHGLDPNVEIVPKGTLSWGSRSSSSASNAWGSSSLSPNTDGSSSSPSHLSTRPSSGGSGIRPSTAGSDKALDPTTSAWGSNCRPSSASGALPTNQSSLTSLRPHSAETRPGSSQLSRFAEPLIDNPGAWNGARTAEKLGVTQPKNDGFSLSSGHFPSLGSDKDKSVLNSELQDQTSHARPCSSSGPQKEINETSVGENILVNANIKSGVVDSWRRDYQPYNEDGVRPNMEKWQGNSQPYPNTGFPQQHYDAWNGPPVNNPPQGCVWFRGPPNGPPFGNPVAPSGFPIEPFPYYRPHIPSTGLANPQPVPPPGTGPRGYHKNGDVYRPHIPDAYIHPTIPIRPGFYPGSMAYEGYYSPPMGYCNSNERDAPFIGMASGPSVYNRFPNQNSPEPGSSQGRSGGHGNARKQLTSELVEPSHPPDGSGPYRVILKHEPDGENEPTNWEASESTNASYVNGNDRPRMTVRENEQRSNYRKTEMNLRTSVPGKEVSSEKQVSSSVLVDKAKFPDISGRLKKSDDISARKLDGTSSEKLEMPPRQSALKEASLIQKIEGLNAKARDNPSARIGDEQKNKFHTSIAPANRVKTEIGAGVVFPARTHTTEAINPVRREVDASAAEKSFDSSGVDASRRTAHGMQGKGDHHSKGRLNDQDAAGWRKKSIIEESSASSGALLETSNVLVGDHCISVNQVRHDGETVQFWSDPTENYAQRAKMKELAKQRTKQLQEEEEERIKMQKAKALAKLDELNKRSQSVEWSTDKEYATSSAIQNKQVKLQPSELATAAGKSGVVTSNVCCNVSVVCQTTDNTDKLDKPPIFSGQSPLDTLKNSGKEPVPNYNQSATLQPDAKSADATDASQVHNNISSKQKRMSNKQKQILPLEKTFNVSATSTAPKVKNDAVVDVALSSDVVTSEVGLPCDSGLPMNSSSVVESSVNLKKKNNRNGKNKYKVEESSSPAALPTVIPKETKLSKISLESGKSKLSSSELDQGSLQPEPLSKDPNQFSEQHRHVENEESSFRTNSQWKSQHPRRTPRNMQANRPTEKSHGSDAVMWAPVKPPIKTEVIDKSDEKCKIEAASPIKTDQQVHNLKNKRAEMERYVPKPVAKEMAQQGTSQQQLASFISQAHIDDNVGRDDSGLQCSQIAQHANSVVGSVGSGMESKNRDGRHTKQQGKAHGSWRQRNITEPSKVHDMKNGLDHDLIPEPIVFGPTGHHRDQKSIPNVERPSEHHHEQSESRFMRGQTKHFNDCNDIDVSCNPDNHDSVELVSSHVTRDPTSIGRGKRHFRGQKGVVGVNQDADHQQNSEREKIEMRISSSEYVQRPDFGAAFKENRGVGERLMSQWQPKSQASNNQRGNRPNDQNLSSVVTGTNKKDSTHDDESLPGSRDNSSNIHEHQHDQLVSEKSKAEKAPHFRYQEAKREKQNAPMRRRTHSPNEESVNSIEQAPTGVDFLHEQHFSSGFGKNGNQNRHGRSHESRGDWKSSTQDNRRHNQPSSRERQYHPVGPYDDSKLDNIEHPKDGNRGGGRFRGKDQTYSRGGNSYGRQSGVD